MRRSVSAVRSIVENQTNWLTETELSLQKMLQKNVIERYNKECSSVDRLIDMIGDCIELAEPIRHLWSISLDTIVVSQNILLTYPEPSPVVPIIENNYDDKLNENQMEILNFWIDSISLGNVILEQDLLSLLDRGLSMVGPFRTKSYLSEYNPYHHLTFPMNWRDIEKEVEKEKEREKEREKEKEKEKEKSSRMITSNVNPIKINEKLNSDIMTGIRKYLLPRVKVFGVDEYTGTVYVEKISKILKESLAV